MKVEFNEREIRALDKWCMMVDETITNLAQRGIVKWKPDKSLQSAWKKLLDALDEIEEKKRSVV